MTRVLHHHAHTSFVLAGQSWSRNVNYRRKGLSPAPVQSTGGAAVTYVCGLTYPALPVIVRSHTRTGKSGAALTNEPIYHSRILSIHTPGPPFCDVIFVGELNYQLLFMADSRIG